jgi:nitrate/nitrite transporter NarK
MLEAIPSVIAGVAIWLLLPDRPAQAAWLTPEQRRAITDQLAQEDTAAHGSMQTAGKTHGVAQALRSGRVWILALVYLAGTFSLYGVSFWMPTIVQELGIGKTAYLQIGLLSMIPWGTAGVAMVWAGARSDRTGERRQHVAGSLFVAAAGLIGLVLVGAQVIPALIALCFVTAGVLSFFATFWSLPTAFLRQTAAAAGIAWINAVGNLGGHFGPDIIGRIRTATGSANYGFLFLAALAVVGALLTIFFTGAGVERVSSARKA